MSTTEFTDRHGRKLQVGQLIRAQVCVGRYGQTDIREGEIVELNPPFGATIKTRRAFNQDCGRRGLHYRPRGSLVWVTLTAIVDPV